MHLIRIFLITVILLSSHLFGSVGKVSLLKGEAFVERNAQKSPLQNGSSLEEKDSIVTGKDAQIQLIFEDKTVITLGSESEFKVEEYLNDTTNPKAKFKFNQGAFKTITGQIGKTAPQNFTMETKTATIGIRGTVVAGIVPPPPPPGLPPIPANIFCLGGTITVAPIAAPTLVVVIPTGSFTQTLTPSSPPAPPAPFSSAQLQQLNQNLGGTPPPPPPGGTPPAGGNTPPTSNPPSGGDGAAAPLSPPIVPQNFTPTAASSAQQSNLQNLSQTNVVQTIANDLGIPIGNLQTQLQTQTCPSGTSGIYPNCVAQSCPIYTIGVYPNCVPLTCPAGTTGTYPNCGTCTALQSGSYPNCVDLTCPTGTTGTYPNCVALTCPSGTTGTYPNCVALTCPNGYVGSYPNCNLPQGGGNSEPTTYTYTRTIMGAQEATAGRYTYLEPTSITFTGSSTLSGNIHAPLFRSSDGASDGTLPATFEIPLEFGTHDIVPYQYNGETQFIIGTPFTSTLPSQGIQAFIEPTGNHAQLVTNFSNQKALIVDFDPTDGSTFLFFGTVGNNVSLSGTTYSYNSGFTKMSEGNASGLFFGTSTVPTGVGLIGLDHNGSAYNAGAYAGYNNGYQATANIIGDMSITGFGVTRYDGNNTSISDMIALTMTRNEGRSIGSSEMILSNNRGSYTLTQSDINKSTYVTDDYFAIVGFDTQESWLVGIPTSISFVENSHVSWGIWGVNEFNASKIYPSANYWVAGENASAAADHIGSLQSGTSYTYNGKAMGRVYDGVNYYHIDPYNDATNAVQLKFNFGNGSLIDSSQSYIKFTVDTTKLWDINVSGAASSGMFSGSLGGDRGGAAILGDMNGSFYGTNAESLGGTFKATVPSGANGNYAMGVFVGKQTPATPSAPFALMGLTTASYLEFVDPYYYKHFESYNEFTLINANNHILGSISLYDGPILDLNSTSVTNSDGTFMIATPHENITQISSIASPIADTNVSWGKWSSTSIDNNATLLESTHNFWVAGDATAYAAAVSHIVPIYASPRTYTSYTYEGKALGKVYDGEGYTPIDPVNDATNTVKLKFKFGNNQAPIDWEASYIHFTANGYWDMRVYPGYADAYTDGSFYAMLSGTGSISGSIDGYFYGANANALGGTFSANDGNNDAFGVFVASKTLAETAANPSYFSLSGFTTSQYGSTIDSIADSITIDLNLTQIQSSITLINESNTTRGLFDLNGTASVAANLNDFNNTKIWTDSANPNDYVSWGYWTATEVDGNATLMAGTNYWVAGKDAATAAEYIDTLIASGSTTSYTYTGKVLGSVIDTSNNVHTINTNTSSVALDFDFGGGQNSLKDTSVISFSETVNNSSWTLKPNAVTVSNGKFSTTLNNTISNVYINPVATAITGAINGQFFGTQAQAVGGTFKAESGGNKALGVFKAVRP